MMIALKTAYNYVYDVAGIFILWILIHYVSANLYPALCAERGIIGFIKSIFISQAPHCVVLRWVIYNGGNAINSMWISIGIWLTTKVFGSIKINKQ